MPVREPELERQGRRLARPGGWFIVVALIPAIPGAVLVTIDERWTFAFGLALLAIASCPLVIGIALLVSSAVSRWAARHRLFA
jgi:uncharacterized membrane protein YhhN